MHSFFAFLSLSRKNTTHIPPNKQQEYEFHYYCRRQLVLRCVYVRTHTLQNNKCSCKFECVEMFGMRMHTYS